MVKNIFLLNIFICFVIISFAQNPPTVIYRSSESGNPSINKPAIDSIAIKHWVSLDKDKVAISNDARYFMYSIKNLPFESNTQVVQSINDSWKKELVGASGGEFLPDSRQFVYLANDTLHFLKLGTDEREAIPDVSAYRIQGSGKTQWLIYQIKNANRELVLQNLLTNKIHPYTDIHEYNLSVDGDMLLLKKNGEQNGRAVTSLEWINLLQGKNTRIWSSENNGNEKMISYYTDFKREQIAFLIENSSKGLKDYSVWYFKMGMKSPVMKVDSWTPGIDTGLVLSESSGSGFTKDGRYIFFWLKEAALPKARPEIGQVDVWSYHDNWLQSVQLNKIAGGEGVSIYPAFIPVEKETPSARQRVVRLTKEGEEIVFNPADVRGDFYVTREEQSGDRFWRHEEIYWLVSLKDGTHKFLFTTRDWGAFFWLSPAGRYLLYYKDRKYYSYDLQTGKDVNISGIIPANLNVEDLHYRDYNFIIPVGLAGWVGEDASALVYDNSDIWQVVLNGSRPAVNITQAYGRLHGLKIRLVDEGNIYRSADTLLLTVFDPVNKYNGLYRVALRNPNKHDLPMMGPWTLYYKIGAEQVNIDMSFENGMMPPIKAGDVNAWIVKRQNAIEAPNYFFTRDFKQYRPLTDLQPQKAYNWLTAELLHWTQTDGTTGQGVLYKPENFDPKKKYPLIIHYYQWLSGRLHQYPGPGFTSSTHPNISWFVSHGYLVFTPDMYYTKGKMVQSVCNTVVSAAESLSKLPYIDGKRMGISGFSWGGQETNWLITQTNLFAAAATGGGVSDDISAALQIVEARGKIRNERMQGMEAKIGYSIWERPDLWLSNSPVLRANKVTTPLLILYNHGDGAWQQGVELFMALRRLEKKVWLLQYDKWGHGVNGKDAEDFTIRITQFFDHYLKVVPPPKWMSQGIPAKLKGIETGYELDTTGKFKE